MKKNCLKNIIFVIVFLAMSFKTAFAQAASGSATADEVDRLREKIASQVAEIKPGVNSKIIVRGKVTETDFTHKSFTLAAKEKTYEVVFPAKTKFFWIKTNGEKLSLNFTNIEIDDELLVIGEKAVGENKITAKLLYGKNFLKNIAGKISKIDFKTHLVTVKTLASETEYVIDIASVADEMKALQNHKTINFSAEKLNRGNVVIVNGFVKIGTKNMLTAKSFYLIQN